MISPSVVPSTGQCRLAIRSMCAAGSRAQLSPNAAFHHFTSSEHLVQFAFVDMKSTDGVFSSRIDGGKNHLHSRRSDYYYFFTFISHSWMNSSQVQLVNSCTTVSVAEELGVSSCILFGWAFRWLRRWDSLSGATGICRGWQNFNESKPWQEKSSFLFDVHRRKTGTRLHVWRTLKIMLQRNLYGQLPFLRSDVTNSRFQ